MLNNKKNYYITISFLVLTALFSIYTFFCYAEQKKITIDDFEKGLNPNWKAKIFKNITTYSVKKIKKNHVLMANSQASASGLIYKINYAPHDYPILTWKWKVNKIIKKGDARKKEGDDYAARVYVIFPHWIPVLSKCINYIWANKLIKGEHIENSYTSNTIMVAIESGEKNINKWITERRNIYDDFKMLFGVEPPNVGSIAIMTDTDNTGDSVIAFYDDLLIEK